MSYTIEILNNAINEYKYNNLPYEYADIVITLFSNIENNKDEYIKDLMNVRIKVFDSKIFDELKEQKDKMYFNHLKNIIYEGTNKWISVYETPKDI